MLFISYQDPKKNLAAAMEEEAEKKEKNKVKRKSTPKKQPGKTSRLQVFIHVCATCASSLPVGSSPPPPPPGLHSTRGA